MAGDDKTRAAGDAEPPRQTAWLQAAEHCITDYWQSHRDPQDAQYNECDRPGEQCAWCDLAAIALAGIRAALAAARAPRAEQVDPLLRGASELSG